LYSAKSLEESGCVDVRYSRQDGQTNEDRLTENSTVTITVGNRNHCTNTGNHMSYGTNMIMINKNSLFITKLGHTLINFNLLVY